MNSDWQNIIMSPRMFTLKKQLKEKSELWEPLGYSTYNWRSKFWTDHEMLDFNSDLVQ